MNNCYDLVININKTSISILFYCKWKLQLQKHLKGTLSCTALAYRCSHVCMLLLTSGKTINPTRSHS